MAGNMDEFVAVLDDLDALLDQQVLGGEDRGTAAGLAMRS
jgi:hypothetical protein